MTPDANELLAHAGFLRLLVRRLVRNEADADDVIQATWLAALAHPPPERRAGLRAWLATVARNLVRRRHRDTARRQRREIQAARPEAMPSTAQTVSELSVHRSLVESVLALAEPYRTTVVLRFLHERTPQEIARSFDVPVATIRTRLHRALAMLRARLDERERDWRTVVTPWLATSSGWAGGAIVAAAITVTAMVMFLRFGNHDAVPASRAAHTHRATVKGTTTPPASPPTREPSPTPRDPTPAATALRPVKDDKALRLGGLSPTGTIEGIVVQEIRRKKRPVSDGTAYLLAYDNWHSLPVAWHETARTTPVNASGKFAFGPLAAGAYAVGVRWRGVFREASVVVERRRATKRVVIAYGSATIRGRVLDELGRGVSERLVSVSNAANPLGQYIGWARTSADGSFVSRGWSGGSHWVTAPRAPRSTGAARSVTVAAGGEVSIDLGTVRPLPRWSGTVRTPSGAPAQGPGRIQIMPLRSQGYAFVPFDRHGHFSAPVAPGRYRVVVHLPGVRFATASAVTVPETDLTHDVKLPGHTVRGTASGAQRAHLSRTDGSEQYKFGSVAAVEGRFRFDGVSPGLYRIRAGRITATIEVRKADIEIGSLSDAAARRR